MERIKNYFVTVVAVLLVLLPISLPAQIQQWICKDPYGNSWEGIHSVKYFSYIPIDNILGPTPCFYGVLPVIKRYKGDGNAVINGYPPQSWRTSEFYSFRISDGWRGGFWKSPMQTRNYGYDSPVNGGTLTAADEDGVANDCYHWNAAGYADNSSWQYLLLIPSSTKGEVRYWGSGANPLEPVSAPIVWDMKTEVDISDLDYVTARVTSISHTCYPAHVITVNNVIVHHYVPPRNDPLYITNCLLLQLDKVEGSQAWSTHVPCN